MARRPIVPVPPEFGRTLMDAEMVSRKLGQSPEWFYRHRHRLETEHGFPPPLAAFTKRWDPLAIDRWLERQMPEELRERSEVSAKERDEAELERHRRILGARLGQT